jgi:hypothetical protein
VKSDEANQCRFLECEEDAPIDITADDDWSVITVPDDDAGPIIQECHLCQQVQDGVCVGPPIDTSIVVGQMGTPTAAASYELVNCSLARPTMDQLEERLEVYYHKIEGPSYCEPWDQQEAHSEASVSPEACKAACLAKASCGAMNWFPNWPADGNPINCFFFPTCDTQNPSDENGQVYIKQVFKAPMTPATPPPSPSPTLQPTGIPTTPIVAIPEPPSQAPTIHTDVEPTPPPTFAPTAPPTPSYVEFFIGIPTETVDSYTSAKQSTLQRSLSAVLDVDETEIALFITDADDAINQGATTIGTLNGQLRRLRSGRKLVDALQATGIAVRVKIESPSTGDDAVNELKDVVAKVDSDDFISHLISTVEVLQSITGPEASIEASKMTYEQNCVETEGSLPCLHASSDLGVGDGAGGEEAQDIGDFAWSGDGDGASPADASYTAAEEPVPAPAPGSSYENLAGAVQEAGLTEADVAASGGDVEAAIAAAPASAPLASDALRKLAEVQTKTSQVHSVEKSIFAKTVVLAGGFAAVAIALVGYIRNSATAKAGSVEGDMEMQVRDC